MTTRYLSCAETAKLIRTALREAFPGFKFSVKSHTYSGGASIDVNWTDGPAHDAVKLIADRFCGGYFDGMTDYQGGYVCALNGEAVHFGATFVFCNQEISPARQAATLAALESLGETDRHNLQMRLKVGKGTHWGAPDPWTGGEGDRRFLAQQVARKLLPAVEARPSPTADSCERIRSY